MIIKKNYIYILLAASVTLSKTSHPMLHLIKTTQQVIRHTPKIYNTQQAFFKNYTCSCFNRLRQLIQNFRNKEITKFMMMRNIKKMEDENLLTKSQIVKFLQEVSQLSSSTPYIKTEINLFLKYYAPKSSKSYRKLR